MRKWIGMVALGVVLVGCGPTAARPEVTVIVTLDPVTTTVANTVTVTVTTTSPPLTEPHRRP